MDGIDAKVLTLPILGAVADLCPLPDPAEVTYWQNRGARIFTIDYELDDNYVAMDLQRAILQINYDDMNTPESELKPIVIQLHSFGGDSYQAYALADTILTSRTPVITVAASVAMSAGFIILIAGHKRYALPHAQALDQVVDIAQDVLADGIQRGLDFLHGRAFLTGLLDEPGTAVDLLVVFRDAVVDTGIVQAGVHRNHVVGNE